MNICIIIITIVVNIISLFSAWFIFSELLFLSKNTRMDFKIYKFINLRYIISLILSCGLVLSNYFLYYPWFLNDLVSIAIIASVNKIFKATKMSVIVYIML